MCGISCSLRKNQIYLSLSMFVCFPYISGMVKHSHKQTAKKSLVVISCTRAEAIYVGLFMQVKCMSCDGISIYFSWLVTPSYNP